MTPRVVVLGGGVAGLASALTLARAGVPVDVLERDSSPAPFGRRSAASWVRPGVPQVRHGHVFGSDCHRVLAAELPEVLDLLLAAGAQERETAAGRPALAMRRPLLDWVLRRVAERTVQVRVHAGVTATGLRFDAGRVAGVLVRGGDLAADVVVDATGRGGLGLDLLLEPRTPAARQSVEPRTGSGLGRLRPGLRTYYSRDYALRWPGDPGPLNFGLAAGGALDDYHCRAVPGDNHTVTVTFAVTGDVCADPTVPDLSRPGPFQIAAERVPMVADWVDPRAADPISEVAVLVAPASPRRGSMGSDVPAPQGVITVGDARRAGDPLADEGVGRALSDAVACVGTVLGRSAAAMARTGA